MQVGLAELASVLGLGDEGQNASALILLHLRNVKKWSHKLSELSITYLCLLLLGILMEAVQAKHARHQSL